MEVTELKKHQKAMTIDEQIENLKSLGLIVSDEDYARKVLNDISYFRLIKAYGLGLKPKNGEYHENVLFEDIVNLYTFNLKFRYLLFPLIESIEVNLRCRLSNYFCCKYGVLGYKEKEIFANEKHFEEIKKSIKEELSRNKKAPFVRNFKENYEGGDLPFYALVEVFSFGTLSKYYKNLNNDDKKEIAKLFGVSYKYLESWLEHISYVRNICAHYGRLYNAKMPKTPILYKEYTEKRIGNNRVFATLICIKHLLKDNEKWEIFVGDLEELINKYDNVRISTMGFPENWKELLISK